MVAEKQGHEIRVLEAVAAVWHDAIAILFKDVLQALDENLGQDIADGLGGEEGPGQVDGAGLAVSPLKTELAPDFRHLRRRRICRKLRRLTEFVPDRLSSGDAYSELHRIRAQRRMVPDDKRDPAVAHNFDIDRRDFMATKGCRRSCCKM